MEIFNLEVIKWIQISWEVTVLMKFAVWHSYGKYQIVFSTLQIILYKIMFLTWSFFSWVCLVILSDCLLVLMVTAFSLSSSHWARLRNLWPICLSRVRVERSWALVSSRRLWWAAHSRWAVSRARSSIWGTPQRITLSLLVSTDASKVWPFVQFSCKFCKGHIAGQ